MADKPKPLLPIKKYDDALAVLLLFGVAVNPTGMVFGELPISNRRAAAFEARPMRTTRVRNPKWHFREAVIQAAQTLTKRYTDDYEL